MTTVERQIPEDEAERPPTRPAEHRQAEGDRERATRIPWYRRISFWRSVAGMAVAIAVGCAAVALETASELSSRSTFFHRRIELLRPRISELRRQAADAERQLAAIRAERTARVNVNRVLSATDVMVLQLKPGAGSNARGLVAISRQAGGAIIEIAGLPAAVGRTCVVWWLTAQGSPTKAAAFKPDSDGRLSLAIQMPPRRVRIAGAIITLEPGKPVDQPRGAIMLKGVLLRPQVVS